MRTTLRDKKKGLKSENLSQLQSFIDMVKRGDVKPFDQKVEFAKRNLHRDGFIK